MVARRLSLGLILLSGLALLLIGQVSSRALADAAVEQEIKARVEQIRAGKPLRVQDAPVAAVKFIPKFYELRNYKPAWTDKANVEALLMAVQTSPEQGLDPADFHAAVLEQARSRLAEQKGHAGALADFDILMTDSLVRLGGQLVDGKLDPEALDASWNFGQRVLDQEPEPLVNEAIESGGIAKLMQDLEPQHPAYEEFKAILATYREIAAKGGWQELPDGSALKAGVEDSRVAVLRDRLIVTGDLTEMASAGAQVFDEPLEQAVKRFQERHGLEADGAVGPGTRAAMNMSVEAKIDQIRVNLERARWVLHGLNDTFIIVNIAGFRTYVVKDDEDIWTTRSIVGTPFRKTPVFREDMNHLVFNPTWTVPRGILGRSILPKAQEDPSFLTEKNFTVVDSDGQQIDPKSVKWSKYSAKDFPYQIVQAPGPNNALGQVKFMFPNKYAVYLHDTPEKPLFERSERAFSSGCIRIDNPLDLAELLLRDNPDWDRKRIEEAVASGKNQTVNLDNPMPVLLLYWTIDKRSEDGAILFMKDIYERDAKILQGLDADYVIRE